MRTGLEIRRGVPVANKTAEAPGLRIVWHWRGAEAAGFWRYPAGAGTVFKLGRWVLAWWRLAAGVGCPGGYWLRGGGDQAWNLALLQSGRAVLWTRRWALGPIGMAPPMALRDELELGIPRLQARLDQLRAEARQADEEARRVRRVLAQMKAAEPKGAIA